MLKSIFSKRNLATALITGTLAISTALPVLAVYPNGHQWYIPETVSSSANETATYNVTLFSFRVTQILDHYKNTCNYERIRAKLTSTSSNTQWNPGINFGNGAYDCVQLTGYWSQNTTIQLYLGTYCEIAPGTFSSATYRTYYYGNNSNLDAYATVESDWD